MVNVSGGFLVVKAFSSRSFKNLFSGQVHGQVHLGVSVELSIKNLFFGI